MSNVLYLPLCPSASEREMQHMAAIIREFEEARSTEWQSATAR